MNTDDIKKALTQKSNTTITIPPADLLSTGSTLLNLACTGSIRGGFAKGRYYFVVGDSSSGKTFLTLTCMAEAARNKNFENHRLIFDNAEDGALMNFEKFFGAKMAERVEPPGKDGDEPRFSNTIEGFYFHVHDAIKESRPFIYVLDSMDSLSSESEGEKFLEKKAANRKGKEVAGSYGDGKAKMNSSGLRQILPYLKKSGSILIVISQTRDNLGFGFEKKTRSGGRALRFYATLELWSSVKGKTKTTHRGKQLETGIIAQVQIKKNRITGREPRIEIPIHHTYGIDDIGSCINYLIEEGQWTSLAGRINAPDFKFNGRYDNLIAKIEEDGLEMELRSLVGKVWREMQAAIDTPRKKRYS